MGCFVHVILLGLGCFVSLQKTCGGFRPPITKWTWGGGGGLCPWGVLSVYPNFHLNGFVILSRNLNKYFSHDQVDLIQYFRP